MKLAVILAGAVAKGAFEAGALDALTSMNELEIVRLVGTSSGALNAVTIAGGVHRGDPHGAAQNLCELWENSADLWHAFDLDVKDALRLRGLSDQKLLRRLLETYVTPQPAHGGVERRDLLHIVLAALNGVAGQLEPGGTHSDATTYEAVKSFDGSAFASSQGLSEVFEAAVASASFPGLFAPSPVRGLGACVDGGTVNNNPIKYALSVRDVDAIVLIAPTVQALRVNMSEAAGIDLAGHLADMLVNERLYRDLREAHQVNDALEKLAALDQDVKRRVLEALGWTGRKQVAIYNVRPLEPLPGNSFSGFVHKSERKACIEIGRARAREVLHGTLSQAQAR